MNTNVVHNAGYIIALLFSCTLAVLVLLRSRRKAGILFSALTFSVAIWILCNFMADNTRNVDIALLWSKFALIGPILIGPLFLIFVEVFSVEDVKLDIRKVIVLISTAIPLLALTPTSLNIRSVELQEFGITFTPGVLYIVFMLYFGIFLIISFHRLFKKYKIAKGVFRSQILFLSIGIVLTITLAIVTAAILPILGYSSTSFVGPVSSLVFLSTTTYTLLRHRLFGIRLIVGRTIYIVAIALIPFASFYCIYYIQEVIWGGIFKAGSFVSGFFFSIAFVYFLLFANTRLTRFINTKIINPGYDPQKERDKLSKALSTMLSLDQVAQRVMSLLMKTTKPTSASILIFDLNSRKLLFQNSNQFDTFSFEHVLYDVLIESRKIEIGKAIVLEELELEGINKEAVYFSVMQNIKSKMKRMNISVLISWYDKTPIVGMILLGERSDMNAYTSQDIDFLEAISLDLSIVAERALLYKEVQDFSRTLQAKVDVATKKLKIQNEQLKEMDKMKDDLISIAGHELRTPATIAKGNLYLLKKKINSPERDKYLERATEAIEREAELVTILLEASRIGKDTLELMVEPLQLEELSKATAEDHRLSAEKKGLKITFEPPKAAHSQIYGDKTRIREIMDNLTTNAVKYTEKGSIKIWTEEKDDKVWFHIQDTGVGIPADELPNLFQKFYRIRNYTSSTKKLLRPGGTGLGLYVSKNLAKRHGGDVFVESKVGVGSTFSFYIPLSFKGNLSSVKDLPKDLAEQDLFKVMGLSRDKRAGVVNTGNGKADVTALNRRKRKGDILMHQKKPSV